MSNNKDFEINDGILFKYHGKDEIIFIPNEVNTIGSKAFQNNDIIKTIEIPNSVTTIEDCAFKNCGNLTSVTLPNSIKIIYKDTFCDCINLTKIIIPDSVEVIGNNAFLNCASLEEINLPKNLNKIVATSFDKCTNLKSVTSSKNEINLNEFEVLDRLVDGEEGLFFGCPNLENISISILPILSIEIQAKVLELSFNKNNGFSQEETTYINLNNPLSSFFFFRDYPQIISFLLPTRRKLTLDNLKNCLDISIKENYTVNTAIFLDYKAKNYSIEEINVFEERNELLDIGLELPNLYELGKNWIYNYDGNVVHIFGYKGSNKHCTIPSSLDDGTKIEKLGYICGYDFQPLETLNIQAEITEIDRNAFWNCLTLKEIVLPNSITSINSYAFTNCVSLKKIILPDKLKAINPYTFSSCKSLEEVVIPESVTKIDNEAFSCCKSLKEITIPASVETIGDYAFSDCTALTKVNFLGKIPKFGENAFGKTPVEKDIKGA